MKDPAVLFYTQDFLVGTITMNHAHRGMYILLLCMQHQKGYLTEVDILSICGELIPEVISKFIKTEEGTYYNERLRAEAEKRAAYTASRRNNLISSRKKAVPPNSNNVTVNNQKITQLHHMDSHMEKHMVSHMEKHMDSHMENENENENIGLSVREKGGEKFAETSPTESNSLPPAATCEEVYDKIFNPMMKELETEKDKYPKEKKDTLATLKAYELLRVQSRNYNYSTELFADWRTALVDIKKQFRAGNHEILSVIDYYLNNETYAEGKIITLKNLKSHFNNLRTQMQKQYA